MGLEKIGVNEILEIDESGRMGALLMSLIESVVYAQSETELEGKEKLVGRVVGMYFADKREVLERNFSGIIKIRKRQLEARDSRDFDKKVDEVGSVVLPMMIILSVIAAGVNSKKIYEIAGEIEKRVMEVRDGGVGE